MTVDNTNPYVGLRPFETDESILFFGRNDQSMELIERLHKHYFVAVVGSSGSGKSSLLRAGLIPLLKAGYLVDDSDRWCIAIMKPGKNPLFNLIEALLSQLKPNFNKSDVVKQVDILKEEGVQSIIDLVLAHNKNNDNNYFLLIDQFEELFRFAKEAKNSEQHDDAIDFVNIILELSQQELVPFYIVLTMRSDFIGDCSQFYGLPEAMNKSQYLVPRLNRQQLKMVIEGPAKLYGGNISPSLTSKLINDLGKVQDELPLLQHALMRTWECEKKINKSGELDKKDYQDIGTIERALSNHADEALEGMNKTELAIVKIMFKALTKIDDNRRGIRRPLLLSELIELTGADKNKLIKIIDRFIEKRRSFLMVSDVGDSDDKLIDISHESLIRQWNTLKDWVLEEADSASYYKKLSDDYILHDQKKKDLLTGTELELASKWHHDFKPTPVWAKRYNNVFEECMVYLKDSENAYALQLKKEEKRIKRKKLTKRILVAAAIILIPILTYYLGGKLVNYEKMAFNKAKSLNTLEGYKLFIQEYKDTSSVFYKDALEAIIKEEQLLDEDSWKLAVSEGSIESYTQYLKYSYTHANKKYDSIASLKIEEFLNESRVELRDDNVAWGEATSANTVTSYIDYIINANNLGETIFDTNGDSIGVRHSKEAYKNLLGIQRKGWLFSGRLSADKDRVIKDPAFKIVWRITPLPFSNATPQVGDFIEAIRIRSTYKKFIGSAVIERNEGEPIKLNEKARVNQVEIIGSVIFLEILY